MTSHSNVLQFFGLRRSEDAAGLVELISPWMQNGNMLTYVKNNEHVKRVDLVSAFNSWQVASLILSANQLSQVARGLHYLHEVVNLIHGDLKCVCDGFEGYEFPLQNDNDIHFNDRRTYLSTTKE